MREPAASTAESLGVAALLILIGVCAFHPIYAVDFFWHLKLGEVIAERGSIPHTNLFSSAAPERPYVQFNWLWEVLAAGVVRGTGLRGLRVVQAAVLALSFLPWYAAGRRLSASRARASCVVALAFVLFEDRFQERPSALLLAFVGLMLPSLLTPEPRTRPSELAALFALGALWTNLHGGESVLLPLSFGALFAGELLSRHALRRDEPGSVRAAGYRFATALAAVLASPTSLPGWWSFTHTIGAQIDTGNAEWLPTYTMLRNGWRPTFVLIALAPSVVAAGYLLELRARIAREGRAALQPAELLLCLGYLVLAHQAVRNAFLCLVPALFMMRRWSCARKAAPSRATAPTLACVALLAIAVEDAIPYAYGSFARFTSAVSEDVAPGAFPELAAQFMHEAELEGGMINDGRWGGYLIWRLWPRCSVFVDSRSHLTPQMWNIFRASNDPASRPAALTAAASRYAIELAVFRGPSFLRAAPPPSWRLLYKAGDEEVYQHLPGAHAATNLLRTQRWLARAGVAVARDPSDAELPVLATQLGAARYLAQPWNRERLTEAERDARDPDPSAAAQGALQQGRLLWQAGDYAHAAPVLERAILALAGDPKPRYYAAITYDALGDEAHARRLAQAIPHAEALTARQQQRLRALVTGPEDTRKQRAREGLQHAPAPRTQK